MQKIKSSRTDKVHGLHCKTMTCHVQLNTLPNQLVNPHWILFDSESTVHVFNIAALLTDIQHHPEGKTLLVFKWWLPTVTHGGEFWGHKCMVQSLIIGKYFITGTENGPISCDNGFRERACILGVGTQPYHFNAASLDFSILIPPIRVKFFCYTTHAKMMFMKLAPYKQLTPIKSTLDHGKLREQKKHLGPANSCCIQPNQCLNQSLQQLQLKPSHHHSQCTTCKQSVWAISSCSERMNHKKNSKLNCQHSTYNHNQSVL